MTLKLPKDEFDILVQDEVRVVLYDKVVDKLYTFMKKSATNPEEGWKFPRGSRVDIIKQLTGVEF